MIYTEETAVTIANYLLDIQAIKINTEAPFVWASGLRSPIYCDNRIALSYPKIRTIIKQQLTAACKKYFSDAGLVAGVATAGIPQGALLAETLGLPFAYVRSAKKSHGMSNQIEGKISEGEKAVVVEDLVSTGKSSLSAVEALREAGVVVTGMLSIFTYGLPMATVNFQKAQCPLVSLSDYEHLINVALDRNYITTNQRTSLQQWRKSPQEWSKSM